MCQDISLYNTAWVMLPLRPRRRIGCMFLMVTSIPQCTIALFTRAAASTHGGDATLIRGVHHAWYGSRIFSTQAIRDYVNKEIGDPEPAARGVEHRRSRAMIRGPRDPASADISEDSYDEEVTRAYLASTTVNCTSALDGMQWYCKHADALWNASLEHDIALLRILFTELGFTHAMYGTDLKQLHESDNKTVASRVTDESIGVTMLNPFEAHLMRHHGFFAEHGYHLKLSADKWLPQSVNTDAPAWVNATTLDLSRILRLMCDLKHVSYLTLASSEPFTFGGSVSDGIWAQLPSCAVWHNLRGLVLQGVKISVDAAIVEQCVQRGIMSELIIADCELQGHFHVHALFRGPIQQFMWEKVPRTTLIIPAPNRDSRLEHMTAIIVTGTQLSGDVMKGIIAQLSNDISYVHITPTNPDMSGTFNDANVGRFCDAQKKVRRFSLSYIENDNARANITGHPNASVWSHCRIQRFELMNLNLSGEFPFTIFSTWTGLEEVRIVGHPHLHGRLPDLPYSVKKVILRRNAFRGPFPLSWKALSVCEDIDVSHNDVRGSDERMETLTREHTITRVHVSGVIPWGRTRRDRAGDVHTAHTTADPLDEVAHWDALRNLDVSHNPIRMRVDDLVPRLAFYPLRKINLAHTQLFGSVSDCTFIAFQATSFGSCPLRFVSMKWNELDLSSNNLESHSCSGCRMATCIHLDSTVSIVGTFFPQYDRQTLHLDYNPLLARLPNYMYARFRLSLSHTAIRAAIVNPFASTMRQGEQCATTLPTQHCVEHAEKDKTRVCLYMAHTPLIEKRFPSADCYETKRNNTFVTLTARELGHESTRATTIVASWTFASNMLCRCRLGWVGDGALTDNNTRVNCTACGDSLYGVSHVDEDGMDRRTCMRCPKYSRSDPRKIKDVARVSISACKCDQGRYMEDATCEACPAGTFFNGTGAVSRLSCYEASTPHKHVEDEWGTSNKKNHKYLMGCSYGTFQHGQRCVKCPKGYYSNTLNANRCNPCPLSPDAPLTTLAIGASSENKCVCEKGYRALNAQRSNKSEPLRCVACTKGLICDDGLHATEVMDGYVAWFTAPHNGSAPGIEVFACVSSDACPGIRPIGTKPGRGACASRGLSGVPVVDLDFAGANPPSSGIACAECGDGYYWDGAVCALCEGAMAPGVSIVVLVLVSVFTIGLCYRLCLASTTKFSLEYVDHRVRLLTLRCALSSALSNTQMLMLFGSMHVAWGGFAGRIFDALDYVFHWPFQHTQCQLRMSTQDTALFAMAAKNGFPFLVVFVICGILYLINRCTTESQWRPNLWLGASLLFNAFEVFSVMLFTNAWHHGFCLLKHPAERTADSSHLHSVRYSLTASPSVLVNSATGSAIQTIAIASTSVLIGAYFIVWLYIIVHGRSLIFTSERFRRFALDFFLMYDDRVFWYPAVVVLRRILLVCATVSYASTGSALLHILCILVIALFITVMYKPYRRYDAYWQEVVLLTMHIFIVALALQQVGGDAGTNMETRLLVVITIFASYVFLVAYFVRTVPWCCWSRQVRNIDGSNVTNVLVDKGQRGGNTDIVQGELQFAASFYKHDMPLDTLQLMLHVLPHRVRDELQAVYRHFKTSINGGYLGRGSTRPYAARHAGLYDIMSFCGQHSVFHLYFSSHVPSHEDVRPSHWSSSRHSPLSLDADAADGVNGLREGSTVPISITDAFHAQREVRPSTSHRASSHNDGSTITSATPQIQDSRFRHLSSNSGLSRVASEAALHKDGCTINTLSSNMDISTSASIATLEKQSSTINTRTSSINFPTSPPSATTLQVQDSRFRRRTLNTAFSFATHAPALQTQDSTISTRTLTADFSSRANARALRMSDSNITSLYPKFVEPKCRIPDNDVGVVEFRDPAPDRSGDTRVQHSIVDCSTDIPDIQKA